MVGRARPTMQLVSAGLPERVAEFLQLYSTKARLLRLGVAVSGGADSVVLLHILNELKQKNGIQLTVLHVNHLLRGFESQNDEFFVRDLAASMAVPVFVVQGPPPPGNLEAQARRVRQEFFRQACRDRDLDFVALGHTASDQAETVLFRLLRGSGLRGLAGMRSSANGLLRPLLSTFREEILGYAEQNQLKWREDSTNRDKRFRRNRLRIEIMPELVRHFNPQIERVLTGYAAVAQDEEDYWLEETTAALARLSRPLEKDDGLLLDAPTLIQLHPALQRRVIRMAIGNLLGHLSAVDLPHIEAILKISASSHGHDRVQIPGADILRSFETLLIAPPQRLTPSRDYAIEMQFGSSVTLPYNAGLLSVDQVTSASGNCVTVKNKGSISAEEAALDGYAVKMAAGNTGLRVRNWRPGDRILTSGATHCAKLKGLFQEHRVLLWERRHWPVLMAGEQIVWVRRFGVAARFAATVTSREVMMVRYVPFQAAGRIVSESKDE